jgi:hypothetical protein
MTAVGARDREPGRLAALGAAVLVAIVYLWFWKVSAHRIMEGPSYAGFAYMFRTGCGDFEHFYHAALAMREGRDIYGSGVYGYIYPPLIAFLYMPLTYLSVQAAASLMLALNMALALWCTWEASRQAIHRLDGQATRRGLLAVMALTTLLAAPRVRSELQMWQTNMLMMSALVLALKNLDTRPRLAGLLLGFAINIKYLPLVFIPWLLLRRRHATVTWSVLGTIAFAMLPAVQTGLEENAREWAVAASGLARLLGIVAPTSRVLNIESIASGFSLSVTSAFARILGSDANGWQTWALSGMVFIAVVTSIAVAYRRAGTPLLAWPSSERQSVQPYLGSVQLDWAAVVVMALAFSPQTNPRHASLLLMVYAPVAAMICLPGRGTDRRLAWTAAAILFGGFVVGSEVNPLASVAGWWNRVGGQSWCMLATLPLLYLAQAARMTDRSRAMPRSASEAESPA